MRKEAVEEGRREQRALRPVGAGEIEITEREQGGVRVLHVAGELDLSTAPALCLRLESARRVADARVLVDLSHLEFCDSTGLRALILAAQEIATSAGRFGVVVPSDGAVAKMFTVCGASELLRIFPGPDIALAALAVSST
jgi:anti-sigma B factor antagonist